MNDKSCDPLVELLVGYADGELPADQSRRVADHLAACPDCQAELHLLNRSLELARQVWHESAACAPTAASRQRPDSSLLKESCAAATSQLCATASSELRATASSELRATASSEAVPSHARTEALLASKQWHTRRWILAAACLAACVVVLLLAAGPWLFSQRQPRRDVNRPEEIGQSVPEQPAEEVDLEALIAREGRSARLAAAARLLATQPGLEDYAREAQRYLAEAYRGTAAVDGTLPPSPSPRNKEPES
jgi:hypothetical protein